MKEKVSSAVARHCIDNGIQVSVASFVKALIDRGYKVEFEDEHDPEYKWKLYGSKTGYKWLVRYSQNDKGVFTADSVELFDPYTNSKGE